MWLGFAHSVVGGAVLRFLRLVCFLSSCAGLSNLWAHSESVQPTDLIENLVLADPSSVRQVTAPAGTAVVWLPLLMLGRSLVEGEDAASRGISQLHQAACNFTLNFRTGAWILRSGEWILCSYLLCNPCCTGFQSPETLNCNHQPALKLHKSLWKGFCLHMFCVIMS